MKKNRTTHQGIQANSKGILINLTVLLITSILGITIVEISLRVYGIIPTTDRLYAYEFDEILGWKPKKSFKYFRSTPYYAHFNYYNPEGFPTNKANWSQILNKTKPTIALLGDSFTEGYYLPYEWTFAYLLGEKFTKDIQILNLGVSGYAPDQYLLSARRYLESYNISAIIVMFFPNNDIPDIFRTTYQGYAKPIFGEDLEVPVNIPLPKLKGKSQSETWLQRLAHSSAIYTATRAIVRKHFAFPESTDNTLLRYEESKMQKALSLIAQIHLEFPEKAFLVYYIPRYEEIVQGMLADNLATFEHVCTTVGIRCFSMAEILHSIEHPQDYYMVEDGHFSRQGARAVAEHLYTTLSQPGSKIGYAKTLMQSGESQ